MPLLGRSATAPEGVTCHLKQITVRCFPWQHGQRSSECLRASVHIENFPNSPLCEHYQMVIFVQHPFPVTEPGPPRIEAITESSPSPLSTRIPPVGKVVATTVRLYALQQCSLEAEIQARIHPDALQFLLDCYQAQYIKELRAGFSKKA